MNNYNIKEIKSIFEQARKEKNLNSAFKIMEEKYPGCLEDKKFADFFVKNGYELTGDTGRYASTFYNKFSGNGKIGLIENFDLYDLRNIFPNVAEKLNKDIINMISPSDYTNLGLNENLDRATDDDLTYLNIEAASKEVEGKKGNISQQGILINKGYEYYDEDGNYIVEHSSEGTFIPLNDFSKSERWGRSDTELANTFESISESIKRLPYNNLTGLLKQMNLLPEVNKDPNDITNIISNRKISDINNTISEINRDMKEQNLEKEEENQK